jgi:hypothetical protein
MVHDLYAGSYQPILAKSLLRMPSGLKTRIVFQ